MAGIDFTRAAIEQREPLSFVRGQVTELLPRLRKAEGVAGCVLLATCNRTELYLHSDGTALDSLALLCEASGIDTALYRPLSVSRADADVVHHLMSVAAGLESQIFGEDQIITQVREAAALARTSSVSDSVLDTLFRCAVAAGKRVKTEARLVPVPVSAAEVGMSKAKAVLGPLKGKRAVVIGNGEMGRLAAAKLRDYGANVTVTLRTYRHGQTIIPAGCSTHPYERRYEIMDGADIVVSATTSPHCTITAAGLRTLRVLPALIIDLSMPRDVEPAVYDENVTVWNLDQFGDLGDENAESRALAARIIEEEQAKFTAWLLYRQSLPLIEQVKDTAAERVRYDHAFRGLYAENDMDGLLELAVNKTVDLLLGGMKEIVSPERLNDCLIRMRKGMDK